VLVNHILQNFLSVEYFLEWKCALKGGMQIAQGKGQLI
jgi:hypothetical protein